MILKEEKHSAVGRRLHAARLAAERYDVSPLIREWRVIPDATYRATEAGRRRISQHLLKLASETFLVSEQYLAHGNGALPGDAVAGKIEELLERYLAAGFSGPGGEDLAFRLRRARLVAGYRSPRAAAGHFGWKATRYADHESRHRAISFDQAIRYAAAYGIDGAENLLFAKSVLSSASSVLAPALDWSWLREPKADGLARWPALRLSDGKFERLRTPVVLPLELVKPALRDAPIYCLVDGPGTYDAYLIVPLAVEGPTLVVDEGKLRTGRPDPHLNATDPLILKDSQGKVSLGTIVGTIRIGT
jgi:hypothetical protein